MNPLLRAGFLAFCLSSTGSTMAAASNESDLPASALAMEAINTHPAVAAARAAITLEEANRRRLQSGPYEYAFRVGGATRQDNATNRTMQEWDLTLAGTVLGFFFASRELAKRGK